MKVVIVLLLSLTVVTIAKRGFVRRRDQQLWSSFKLKFGKRYSSAAEEEGSRKIFLENDRAIRQHNKAYVRGEVPYKKALNHFSDRREKDIIRQLATLKVEESSNEDNVEEPILRSGATTVIPDKWDCPSTTDWPLRDQGMCGACWAFSALASIEASYFKKNKQWLDLSEQQLTDCVYNTTGCDGGWMGTAYEYLRLKNGSCGETSHRYTGNYKACAAAGLARLVRLNSVKSYYTVASDDFSIKQKIMQYGALAVAVDCSDYVQYGGDVYSTTRTYKPNHAVAVCGWGSKNGLSYWMLRNSWSEYWGDKGYIYVSAERNGTSPCTKGGLFTNYVLYPVIQ